jgi:uncharacterized protein YbjT (DUF2867 family)
MKIKAILLGSTGMLGQAVLLECIENSEVESILIINRHACKISHPKINEIIRKDLFDLSGITNELTGYNTCFFCLGVSSADLKENEYYKITYDLTLNVANILLALNKEMTFCYISGAGTDSSEKGRIMWARVKGKTENALLALPFKKAYMFRPAFIQPLKGIRSRTKAYNVLYAIFKPFYFILKHFDSIVTNTEVFGKAMILTVLNGYDKNVLENRDINKIVRDNEELHP